MFVGEIVKDYPATAPVFSQFGIEFCCRGSISLEDVIEEEEVDEDTIIESLEKAIVTSFPEFDILKYNPGSSMEYGFPFLLLPVFTNLGGIPRYPDKSILSAPWLTIQESLACSNSNK